MQQLCCPVVRTSPVDVAVSLAHMPLQYCLEMADTPGNAAGSVVVVGTWVEEV